MTQINIYLYVFTTATKKTCFCPFFNTLYFDFSFLSFHGRIYDANRSPIQGLRSVKELIGSSFLSYVIEYVILHVRHVLLKNKCMFSSFMMSAESRST